MTWLLAIIRTKLGRAAAIALAVLAGLGLARERWLSQGRTEAERDAQDDAIERVQKGRDAVRDGRGRNPDDRLRDNDGKW